MSTRHRALHPALTDSPFTTDRALELGHSRRRLRGSDLVGDVWGVRAVQPPTSPSERCRMLAVRLHSDVVFSHSTAALLIGVPLPWSLERESRLHITTPAPARAPHAAGILGHRLTLEPHEIVEVDGLRCTAPWRTWRDLGTQLGLLDLVAAGDYLIHHRLPFCTREELADAVLRARSRRGLRTLHRALPLLSPLAESRPESHFRVIVSLSDLPDPHINHTIVQTDDGPAMRPDFSWREYRVIVEYQGDHHRTKEQWRKDMTRRSRLESQGWTVVEINADDLRDPLELVARIARFLARNGWHAR